jgi:hypothetical protein
MAYENKPGDFALFKNDKGDNEKRPDYKGGGLDLNGNDVEIACWIKEGKKGKFMSCKMKLANDRPKAKTDDDPVPF